YGPSVSAPFVYDDRDHVVESPLVRAFQTALDIPAMRAVFDQPIALSRPLLTITYGINYGAYGLDPVVFRRVNLIIHTINAILVFLIAWELGVLAPLQRGQRFALGFLASALFAVHPLLTESVTYISGRSSSL